MDEVITLAKELVQIESTNPGTGESKIREYIKEYLKDSKIEILEEEALVGRKNLIATIPGIEQGPMLVLLCHMDTVVVEKNWTKEPFGGEIKDGKLYGRGSCDMKSGLACALSLFRKTAKEVTEGKRKLKHPFRLICTVDEEGNMEGVEHIISMGYVKQEDYVMDLEPTDGQIQMAHKGRFWICITVSGVTAHASRPEQGKDAIAAAAALIYSMKNSFTKLPAHPEMGPSTITFGQIQGGYQPYVVPDLCKIWIDCRLSPPVTDETVLQLLKQGIEKAKDMVPGIGIEYCITGNRPYIEKHEESPFFLGLQNAVVKVTGKKLNAEVFTGYTDSAVIAGILKNQNCLSYGPGSLNQAHKPDEYVLLSDIERCVKVLAALIDEML